MTLTRLGRPNGKTQFQRKSMYAAALFPTNFAQIRRACLVSIYTSRGSSSNSVMRGLIGWPHAGLMFFAGPRFSSGSAYRLSHHWIRRMRRPNLSRILIAIFTIGTRTQANSPHPSSCEGHLSASRRNSRSENLLVDDLRFQLQARRGLVARSLRKACLDVEAASIMPFESIAHLAARRS
jgi:hypothetical protein